jgi:hypothetical protein
MSGGILDIITDVSKNLVRIYPLISIAFMIRAIMRETEKIWVFFGIAMIAAAAVNVLFTNQ